METRKNMSSINRSFRPSLKTEETKKSKVPSVRSVSRESSILSQNILAKKTQHGVKSSSLVNLSRPLATKSKTNKLRDLYSEKQCSSDSEIDTKQSGNEKRVSKKVGKTGSFKTKAFQEDSEVYHFVNSDRNSVNSQEYSIPYKNVGHFASSNQLYQSEEESLSPKADFRYGRESYEVLPNLRSKSEVPAKVGFGYLPDQVYKKAVKKGFEFSLMVVGESGLGKSTLVNSMFLTNIYSREDNIVGIDQDQTLQVETHDITLEENGVRLALTVVDTPGFGDAVDNTQCWKPIISYVEKQFEDYLEGETRVERVVLPDKRVHACLYFIAPTGHGLKPLDIQFMKRIHNKVNIIPVIGKADSCTVNEINLFKTKILVQLEQNEIQIYDFPESEVEEENQWMRELLPFAVVGSNAILTDDEGNNYRGREYPWGSINIENQGHCDFSPLRHLLLATHMQDLKEVTHVTHYQNFRSQKLNMMVVHKGLHLEEDISENDPLSEEDQSFESVGFEWERMFGKLTNERLEQLQRYSRDSGSRKLPSLGSSSDLNSMSGRNSHSNEKMLWSKPNSMSLQELRRNSLGTYLSGKKMKNLMNTISANLSK